MDVKTLEYMEERAGQARLIVNTIEALRCHIKDIVSVHQVHFKNEYGSKLFDASIGSLTNEMKEAYIKAAENEIGALEQRLAEL